jgi:hypothetical protein
MAYQKALPTGNADGTAAATPSRTGTYNEAYTIPLGSKQTYFADEGTYFTTYNVTDGTGIAGHAAPVQADLSLKPLLHLFNGNATKSIYVDFIRLRLTAIGAGATTTDFTVWVDRNLVTSKTGGTGTVATPVNVNPGSALASAAVITFGVVTASAGTGEVRIDHQRVRSVVPVVEDQYMFSFGSSTYGPATGGITMAGTSVIAAYVHCPPVVVPPGGNFKLSEWGASQSGAHSFEYTIGYWER